tara:strand:+ start:745 stop:1089 length:345 start_codon:yes stop_codon:yes gene_type:complete
LHIQEDTRRAAEITAAEAVVPEGTVLLEVAHLLEVMVKVTPSERDLRNGMQEEEEEVRGLTPPYQVVQESVDTGLPPAEVALSREVTQHQIQEAAGEGPFTAVGVTSAAAGEEV